MQARRCAFGQVKIIIMPPCLCLLSCSCSRVPACAFVCVPSLPSRASLSLQADEPILKFAPVDAAA